MMSIHTWERSAPTRTRRRLTRPVAATAIATALLLVPLAGPAGAARPRSDGAPDEYVTLWDETATKAAVAAGFGPPPGNILFAYVGIAVYDAVVAVNGDGKPFLVDVDAPRGASAEAAVSAAAYRILKHHLPQHAAAILDPAYATSLASIPDGPAESAGVAVGERVAAAVIDLRRDDKFLAAVPYQPPVPVLTETWVPTPPPAPLPQAPLGTFLTEMDPFTLRSADQFRPDGPPDLDSRRWARDYAEVKALGSASSTVRTTAQTEAARFWGEPPLPQAHAAFRLFIKEHELELADAARFLAMMSVTYADAGIACFDAKYHYTFWRPVTAIRAGDSDGNRRTVGDPGWTPRIPTPNHPEYPSAHSCITGTSGIVISRFLHTSRINFTMPSVEFPDDPSRARHFSTPRELTAEISDARIWGGVHFRSSVEDGADVAKRTAHWVLSHHFHQ